MSGQKVKTKTHSKYLRVILDESVIFSGHLNIKKYKLNRANGVLAKLRHYVPNDLQKTVYYSVFDSHMNYACQVWGQSKNRLLTQIEKSQNKVLRLLNFKHFMESSNPIYKEMRILKLEDVVLQNNCLFVYNQLQKSLSNTEGKNLTYLSLKLQPMAFNQLHHVR